MLTVKSKESFAIIIKNVSEKTCYAIESKGQRSYVIINRKRCAMMRNGVVIKELSENQKHIKPLFRSVRSSATKYIKKHNLQPSIIPRNSPCQYSNRELWESLPVGTDFYIMDAKHCYWRIAFILGYIGKTLYKKYCENPDFKVLRNISLAVFNSRHKMTYYDMNNEKTNEIICDTSLYSLLYNNIRHYAYNNSGEIREAIPDLCIAYRVDGIYLLPKGLKRAKEIFEKNNLLYKSEKCTKIDEKNYSTGDGEIKKML